MNIFFTGEETKLSSKKQMISAIKYHLVFYLIFVALKRAVGGEKVVFKATEEVRINLSGLLKGHR